MQESDRTDKAVSRSGRAEGQDAKVAGARADRTPDEARTSQLPDEALALRFLNESKELGTGEFLALAIRRFGPGLSFATSLGLEDQVLLDLLDGLVNPGHQAAAGPDSGVGPAGASGSADAAVAAGGSGLVVPDVFTLDTGRLPEETWELFDADRERYGLDIRVCFPAAMDISELVAVQGARGFRNSVEARKACCRVRKVLPLKAALAGKTAWMTGQRREQSVTRSDLERVEWDSGNQVVKLNPLADWTLDEVLGYIKEHQVPVNSLHARGFPSLGCEPCTRAVKPGEDDRAGRWWWENPEHKECGLHAGNKAAGNGPADKGEMAVPGGSTGKFGIGNLKTLGE